MERSHISELKDKQKAMISGFLEESRILSKVAFLIVRDVTGKIQCVIKSDDSKNFELAKKINKESIVSIIGKINVSKQAMNGMELMVEKIEVLSESDAQLPIPVVEKGDVITALNKRFDYRMLDLRKEKNILMFKVATSFEKGLREYWNSNGYIEIHTPKIIGAASESGSEVFMLPYFGKEAFLAQSPQFYKQMALCSGFEKVFEIGTVFRAENSHTTRHLTEIVMIDMELAFIKDHFEIMDEEERAIKHALEIVKSEYGKEIKEVFGQSINSSKKFPRISFKEANDIIKKMGGEPEKDDLTSAGEKLLGEWALKEHGSDFVFVYNYPWAKKPFYHMKDSKDMNTTKGFDLIYKGCEITTGSQREHRYEVLKAQAMEKNGNLIGIEDYVNFFKYGAPEHGGLAIGQARFIQLLLGLENVREATFIPRDPERITP
ncbi:MAG: aspartate--tRNA(Asn) ligase [Candidatus Nanoarchaeia archaeon]|jgi:aspartyl-tRNA synthetase